MPFSTDNLKNIIELLKPIPPGPGTGIENAQSIGIALAKRLLEVSMYIFILVLVISGMIWLFSLGNTNQVQTAKKSLLYSFIGFLIIVAGYGLLQFVVQQVAFIESGLPDIATLFGNIIKFALLAAGVGFLFILLFAGTRYMFSLGGEEEAAAAKKQMVDAIIGLVLTVAAYSIGRAVIYLVGLAG